MSIANADVVSTGKSVNLAAASGISNSIVVDDGHTQGAIVDFADTSVPGRNNNIPGCDDNDSGTGNVIAESAFSPLPIPATSRTSG